MTDPARPAAGAAGRLTISERAVATIAERAAVEVCAGAEPGRAANRSGRAGAGVRGGRHRRLRRRAMRRRPTARPSTSSPRVSVRLHDDTADVVVTCALPYPDPLAVTAARVRAAVAGTLAAQAGLVDVRVRVDVPALAIPAERRHPL